MFILYIHDLKYLIRSLHIKLVDAFPKEEKNRLMEFCIGLPMVINGPFDS